MKNTKNKAQEFFKQKDFSIVEMTLLVLVILSAIIATFIQGGGPIGLPIFLICIIGFAICRSLKMKDEEIDDILKKIIAENQIDCSDHTIVGYNLKNTIVKKRKDGKLMSPIYYITNIVSTSSEETVFHIYIIDLITSSVTKKSYTVSGNEEVTLIEETIKTNVGVKKMSCLKINGCDDTIPVILNDYKTAQLVEGICNRNGKN